MPGRIYRPVRPLVLIYIKLKKVLIIKFFTSKHFNLGWCPFVNAVARDTVGTCFHLLMDGFYITCFLTLIQLKLWHDIVPVNKNQSMTLHLRFKVNYLKKLPSLFLCLDLFFPLLVRLTELYLSKLSLSGYTWLSPFYPNQGISCHPSQVSFIISCINCFPKQGTISTSKFV